MFWDVLPQPAGYLTGPACAERLPYSPKWFGKKLLAVRAVWVNEVKNAPSTKLM